MSSQASPTGKESSKIGQGVLEMSSSLPSSSSGRFSSANEDSSTRIQVIISPDPNQSHTPPFKDTSTAASSQDENIGVNEKTPPVNQGSLKRKLYAYAVKGDWEGAKSIHDKFPEMIPMRLTENGDTALHIAARADKITFVQELVKMLQTPEDLEITNSNGNTAFCMAAISGNASLLRTMIEKNENLPQIQGQSMMLPVHLAALNGHREIVEDLSTKKMADKDIDRLFFITISCRMYDVATKLLEKYPARLVIARDDQEQLTALHILAREPSQFELCACETFHCIICCANKEEASSGLTLLQKLLDHVRELEDERALDLMTKPSKVIFDAVKSGNIHTLECLLDKIPELLEQKEAKGQNLLHIAALYRQRRIFEFLLERGTANLLMWEVDDDRNNVLHFAARWSEEVSSNLRPGIQLAEEWSWFKQVKKRVPPELRTMRNSKGKTPKDTLFSAGHEKLLKEAQETAQKIAEPCMVAATLIAAIVFPAALTVPGGESNRTNPWFTPFVFANAAALFAACASIIILLTIYTSSWLTENESFICLNVRLTFGLRFLNISVDAMLIAFILASWMIFQQYWARVVVLAMSIPAFVALSYLQYAAVRHARQTLMAIVGKRDIQNFKNFILRT